MDALDILPYELWRAVLDAIESPVYDEAYGERRVASIKHQLRHVCKLFDRIVRETVPFTISRLGAMHMEKLNAWLSPWTHMCYPRDVTKMYLDTTNTHIDGLQLSAFFNDCSKNINFSPGIKSLSLFCTKIPVLPGTLRGTDATFLANVDTVMTHVLSNRTLRNFAINMMHCDFSPYPTLFDALLSRPASHSLMNLRVLTVNMSLNATCNDTYDMRFLAHLRCLYTLTLNICCTSSRIIWPDAMDARLVELVFDVICQPHGVTKFPDFLYLQRDSLRRLRITRKVSDFDDGALLQCFPYLEAFALSLLHDSSSVVLDSKFTDAVQKCTHLRELTLMYCEFAQGTSPIVSTTLRRLAIHNTDRFPLDFSGIPNLEQLHFEITFDWYIRNYTVNASVFKFPPHMMRYSGNAFIPTCTYRNLTHLNWTTAYNPPNNKQNVLDLTHFASLRHFSFHWRDGCRSVVRFPTRTLESLLIAYKEYGAIDSVFYPLYHNCPWPRLAYLEIKRPKHTMYRPGTIPRDPFNRAPEIERRQMLCDKQDFPALQNIVFSML
jgi:hypothetical protein